MVPVHQLDLSKPGMPSRTLPEEPNHVSGDFQLADKALFQEIHRLNPQAVVLRSIPKMDDEDTDSASEDEQSYTFLRKVRRTRSTRMSLPQDMFVPMREIERIEKSTRRQATTLMWREVRYGRITASIINKVRTMRDTTSPKAILDLVLLRTPPLTTEAIRWGVEKEPEAKEAYQKFMETCHSNFRLCSVGFVIDKKDNFLGASPDGIWTCSCHGVGTLEVKCPWTLRHDDSQAKDYECLTADLQLKESHQHFMQVQTQLHVCRKESAHFFVWTPNDYELIVVPINRGLYAPVLEKARSFWVDHVVPELM
ncbi:uncharacterized protein LOC120839695 [Ixodes scapularis]|uniref:uncharacterized protein LOC120839695 n=1 Tax=Ixodes scapularis TaxID=6945 RepID=UPI001C381DF0|nr:uncharacterized protein LOC120839695 [Ixodes scapularis]